MSFVTHLECSRCSEKFSSDQLHNLCTSCQAPILVRYDLDRVGHQLSKTSLLDRPADMWRYIEVLPVDREEDIIGLGEGFTPLLRLPGLGKSLGLDHLFMKDEGVNPTGSFKARGITAAVSMAARLGAKSLCIPTAGNAGGALAAYASRGGLEAHVFMPDDTPTANVIESQVCGAHVTKVAGVISDAAALMAGKMEAEGWFDISTLKEPYRIEGKKTMGYELAEQFDWSLPDVVLYPTGGGTGLIGMWKAFAEMEEMGWIGPERPRMVTVQSDGCAPIVKAFDEGADTAEPWENAETLCSGIRVPKAVGDFLMLQALRESNGTAVAVSDAEAFAALREAGQTEGIFICPEGAACFAALRKLADSGWVQDEERVVIFNTAAGAKYIDTIEEFERKSSREES